MFKNSVCTGIHKTHDGKLGRVSEWSISSRTLRLASIMLGKWWRKDLWEMKEVHYAKQDKQTHTHKPLSKFNGGSAATGKKVDY
jgi:hypothetical protein